MTTTPLLDFRPDTRFDFLEVPLSHKPQPFCAAVTEGLAQFPKTLPCRFFYDKIGSELFEQICELPEYYVTRTERALLEQRAPEMIEAAGDNLALMEFGSGSSHKTRLLLEAALKRQPSLHYVPVDISAQFLRETCLMLLAEYPRLSVTGIAAEYNDSVDALPTHDGPRLLLFLGSNIGNFQRDEATAFLTRIRQAMQPEDRLLVGVDLVKDRRVLTAAYNDAQGITAAFNKNLLARINRELRGEFDQDAFDHDAPFVEAASRIEMWLISRREQTVRVPEIERVFHFAQGEGIHTENSHKYTLASFAALCAPAGLDVQETWTDDRHWFAHFLLRPTAVLP